jgi:hypothetical protein
VVESILKINVPMKSLITIRLMLLALILGACSTGALHDSTADGDTVNQLALHETYDQTINGVRITLTYTGDDNTFNGLIENTTHDTPKEIHLVVYLSNDVQLGPTGSVLLPPGESKGVRISAKNFSFSGWSLHPEVNDNPGN